MVACFFGTEKIGPVVRMQATFDRWDIGVDDKHRVVLICPVCGNARRPPRDRRQP